MTAILFIFLLICCSIRLYSQDRQIDSMLSVLAVAKDDTNKVNTLNAISYKMWSIAKYPDARKYADDALALAERLKYKTGIAHAFNNISNTLYVQRNFPEAIKYQGYVLKMKEEAADKIGMASSYISIGSLYYNQTNYPEALEYQMAAKKLYDEILKQTSKNENPAAWMGAQNGMTTAYNEIGNTYWRMGKYPEALKYLNFALQLNEELGDKRGIAVSYNNIGNIHSDQGNYPEALRNYLAAQRVREEIGDKKSQLNTFFNIGFLYRDMGNYPEALKSFRRALKISEETGSKTGARASYNNIGGIYFRQANYTEALNNYRMALTINEELNDHKGLATSYNNIGLVYTESGNYNEALKNYDKSVNLKKEIGDKRGIAVSYINIGNVYTKQSSTVTHTSQKTKLLNQAMNHYLESLKIYESIGDQDGIIDLYMVISEVYINQNRPAEARLWLNNALLLGIQLGNKAKIGRIYQNLAKSDSAAGNYREALANYKLYANYKDSLLNESNNKQIAQLKEQYESERKDREILQLTSDKQNLENERQINALLLKSKQDSLSIVQAEKERVLLENEKSNALHLYSLQRIELLNNEKELQALQLEKNKADYAIQKAEADKKQEQLLVLSKEKDIQALQLERQKQSKYYFIAGVVLLSLLSFFVYRNYYNQRRAMKLTAELSKKQVMELELQSLRAQLNPHFMFNSLNAIQELILLNENEKSHSYLARFAKLLRMLLENTESPFVTLHKEIDFLELYLSLEKLRIPDLQYSISVDPSVNLGETRIPNMVLQPYIENALWHGLSHKQGDRKLKLRIYRENEAIIYDIEDNGVGRKKAAEIKSLYRKEHKSKGMELLSKRFKLINEEFGSEISTEISDVRNQNEVSGTKVQIKVPLSFTQALTK